MEQYIFRHFFRHFQICFAGKKIGSSLGKSFTARNYEIRELFVRKRGNKILISGQEN